MAPGIGRLGQLRCLAQNQRELLLAVDRSIVGYGRPRSRSPKPVSRSQIALSDPRSGRPPRVHGSRPRRPSHTTIGSTTGSGQAEPRPIAFRTQAARLMVHWRRPPLGPRLLHIPVRLPRDDTGFGTAPVCSSGAASRSGRTKRAPNHRASRTYSPVAVDMSGNTSGRGCRGRARFRCRQRRSTASENLRSRQLAPLGVRPGFDRAS